MKKIIALLTSLLMLIVSSAFLLTSCSINYKPISIKYQNSDHVAYSDGEHKTFLVDLLNNSKWHNDVAKCDCDYTVVMKNDREIFYHSECGTFIDYDFDKSLTLGEEDRIKLNDYFAEAICRGNIHFFDENSKCTVCGYDCNFTWVGKDEGHHKLALCDCCEYSTELEPHVDSDFDNKCDICYHNFYVYYLRYYASCLKEIEADNLAAIKITSEAGGVAPGRLKEIGTTTDEAVMERLLNEYKNLTVTPILREEAEVDGGGAITVTFCLKDGSQKEIYINNGNYYTGDYEKYKGEYYKLDYVPAFGEDDNVTKSYGFITYIGTGTVYDKENNPVCEIPIDELEFVESDGCVDAVVTGYYYTVATEFGTLWFDYSNDLFYLRYSEGDNDYREYYRIVGKNLDELIAEYSANTTD